jgi:FAD synthetase
MRNAKSKMRKVMGFGTFDGVHPGHLFFMKQLRDLGDEVFVVVARDGNVIKIKGKSACFSEKERLEAVKKTGLADHALIGRAADFYHWIKKFRPDVIGLGYDQKADIDYLEKMFPDIDIVRLKALEPEKYKSSILRDK